MADVRDRDYYTVAEAAKELDVSPSTVWRWIEARRLPAYRVGARKIRINKDDLAKVVSPLEDAAGRFDALSRELVAPPSAEELARRREVVARILAKQEGRSIAPLTTGDLIRQVRDEREERYRSWLKPSS
jgi:excisionase family DNA binding protein